MTTGMNGPRRGGRQLSNKHYMDGVILFPGVFQTIPVYIGVLIQCNVSFIAWLRLTDSRLLVLLLLCWALTPEAVAWWSCVFILARVQCHWQAWTRRTLKTAARAAADNLSIANQYRYISLDASLSIYSSTSWVAIPARAYNSTRSDAGDSFRRHCLRDVRKNVSIHSTVNSCILYINKYTHTKYV